MPKNIIVYCPNISRENRGRGASVYGSNNVMLGANKSRRDEMESIGYILICFLRGDLPWQRSRGVFDFFA